MYGLFSDDEERNGDLTRNEKGVLVSYKSQIYSGPRYGGVLVQSIVYCSDCGKAQGLIHSTESPFLIKTPNGEIPEFVVKDGAFKHQTCNYSILKRRPKNGKGDSI